MHLLDRQENLCCGLTRDRRSARVKAPLVAHAPECFSPKGERRRLEADASVVQVCEVRSSTAGSQLDGGCAWIALRRAFGTASRQLRLEERKDHFPVL
jgi:hypothetical protein